MGAIKVSCAGKAGRTENAIGYVTIQGLTNTVNIYTGKTLERCIRNLPYLVKAVLNEKERNVVSALGV